MSSPSSGTDEGAGYPRICAQCGTSFVAARGHARWCSDRCRLRAWRQRNSSGMRQVERKDTALVQQVQALQEALDRQQARDVCARHDCRLHGVAAAGGARAQEEHDAHGTPWRDSEWDHPLVQRLRGKISEQAGELERLREENGLLRRWVSQHADGGRPGMAGE